MLRVTISNKWFLLKKRKNFKVDDSYHPSIYFFSCNLGMFLEDKRNGFRFALWKQNQTASFVGESRTLEVRQRRDFYNSSSL